MNLRQLEVFYAVMRTGSVTEAAKILNVSQPAVSMTLRHFESTLKIELFRRTKGRLTPTPEAEALFSEAAEIFRRVDLIGRSIRDLEAGRLGSLSVAGAQPLINGLLAETVGMFREAGKTQEIFLHSLPTLGVIDRIIDGEVDIGVCFGTMPGASIASEILITADLVCLVPSDHPLASKDVPHIELESIADEPIFTYRPQAALRFKVEDAFSQINRLPNVSIQVNSSVSAHKLVARGLGIAIVEPTYAVFERHPNVVCKPIRPTTSVEIFLLTSADRPLSRAATDFLAMLRTKAAWLTDALDGLAS